MFRRRADGTTRSHCRISRPEIMNENLFQKIRLTVPILLCLGLLAIFVRIWWAGATPNKPTWMPESSVWISGPHTPLEMHRVGEWVGCSSTTQKMAECWFTDYRGSVILEGQFARLDGRAIGSISIQHGDMSEFRSVARKHGEVIPIVRLEQGGIMAPLPYVSNLDISGNPRN